MLWTLWKVVYGLRIQQSSLVDANELPPLSALWLVTSVLPVVVAY